MFRCQTFQLLFGEIKNHLDITVTNMVYKVFGIADLSIKPQGSW